MSIGENIKKARGRIKQSELAEMLNVDVSTVSRWENGKNIPSSKVLQNIANALNTTVAYLSGETDNPERIIVSKQQQREQLLQLGEKIGDLDTDMQSPMKAGITDDAYVIRIGEVDYLIPKDKDGKRLFYSVLQQSLGKMGIKVLMPEEAEKPSTMYANINQNVGGNAKAEINQKPVVTA